MSLIKHYHPFDGFLRELMEFDSWEPFLNKNVSPSFQVLNKDDKFIIRAELPGYEEKDINIEAQNNRLIIKGSHQSKDNSDDVFSSTLMSFEKSVVLPLDINLEMISAEMKSGILAISIPKSDSNMKTRVIPINKQLKS